MPFAVNLKHLGTISSPTIASVLIFPTFTSVHRAVCNCLLSKTNIYVLISWLNFPLTNWKLLLFSEDGKNDRYIFLKQYFSVKQKNFFCFKMSHQREEMIPVYKCYIDLRSLTGVSGAIWSRLLSLH